MTPALTQRYYDACGLQYVVYSEDAPDGRVDVGDLQSITYGFSNKDYENS